MRSRKEKSREEVSKLHSALRAAIFGYFIHGFFECNEIDATKNMGDICTM